MKSMRLLLCLFLVLIAFFIPSVNAAVQVVASNTIQYSNTSVTASSAGVEWHNITLDSNTSGTINLSVQLKAFNPYTDICAGPATAYYQFYADGVALGTEQSTTSLTFVWLNQTGVAVSNLKNLSLRVWASGTGSDDDLCVSPPPAGTHADAENFMIMYDGYYMPNTPINFTYTYNSTGINFSWIPDNIGNLTDGYNVSYQLFDGNFIWINTTNNYIFISADVGDNYTIKVYPNNGTNAFSMNQSYLSINVKMMRQIVMGGTGYNWTVNVNSWGNNTYDRYTNQMTIGNFIVQGFDSTWESNWTYSCGGTSWSLVGSYLVRTGGTITSWCAITPNYWDFSNSLQNSNILIKFNMSSNVAQEQIMPIYHASDVTEATRTYRAMLKHRNNGIYNYYAYNGVLANLGNVADITLSAGTNYYYETKIYNSGKNSTARMDTSYPFSKSWLADYSNTTLTSGKIGFAAYSASGNPSVSIQKYFVRAVDNNGNLLPSATTVFKQIDSGINGNVSQICLDLENSGLIGVDNNVSIKINSSSDNISYTGDITVINANSSNSCWGVPISAQKRYFIPSVTIQYNTSALLQPFISSIEYYIDEVGVVSGYVKYPNGSVVSGATVGYYQNWQTTDSNGYYSFDNVPFGNRTFVAGLNGYRANGDVLIINSTGISNNNITLISIDTAPKNNMFLNTVSNMTSTMFTGCYLDGHCNFYQLYTDNKEFDFYPLYAEEGVMSAAASMVYAWGVNVTPEYTERMITLVQHSAEVLDNRMYNFSDTYEHVSATMNPGYGGNRADFPDWWAWSVLQSVQRLNASLGNSSAFSYWKFSVGNISSPDEWRYNSTWATVIGTNYTNNYAMMEALIDYWRYSNGYDNDAINRVNNITFMFINQTNSNGWKENYDADLETMMYNILDLQQAIFLRDLGYSNETLNQTIYNMMNHTMAIGLQDGDAILEGRNSYTTFREANRIATLIMFDINESENYYVADRAFQKEIRYIGTSDMPNNTINPQYNHFSPKLEIGNGGHTWSHINTYVMFWYAMAGEYYNPEIVETKPVYRNLDDTNGSGILLVNKNNYSIYMFSKYVADPCGYAYGTYCNGSMTLPMIPHATVFDSSYPTIYPNPEVTILESEITGVNYPYFNSGSQYIDQASMDWILNTTRGNNDSTLWLNYSDIPLTTGKLDYYNISMQVIGDAIHVKIVFQNDSNSLTNFRLPIDLVHSDNMTTSNIIYNFPYLNYSRGNETLNITNISSSQASSLNITPYSVSGDEIIGYGTYGSQKKALITGNIDSFPVTVEYDMQISTTNVFNSILDQPPTIYSFDPDPAIVNSTAGEQVNFSVVFDQLVNISWSINGTHIEWDNVTTTGQYSNISSVVGNYTVNATGYNDQGNATISWEWNVVLETVSPASVTNPQTTTGNFFINNSWVNPVDADFNHTVFKYVNGTILQNVSTTSLNFTWSPHYTQNISAQTVDTSGNINETKVWFNATIPNNVPVLASIGNIEVTEGDTIDFTLSTTDADGDTMTNTSNATEGTFTAATGNYNWVTIVGDAGTYTNFNFTVDDGYGGIDMEVITITVNPQTLYPNPVTSLSCVGYANYSVFCSWSAVQP